MPLAAIIASRDQHLGISNFCLQHAFLIHGRYYEYLILSQYFQQLVPAEGQIPQMDALSPQLSRSMAVIPPPPPPPRIWNKPDNAKLWYTNQTYQ